MSKKLEFSTRQKILLYLSLASAGVVLLLIQLFIPATIVTEVTFDSQVLEVTPVLPPPPKPLVINFTGDIMLGRHVEVLLNRHGHGYVRASSSPLLPPADATVVNFESAVALPHISTPSGGMRFSTDVRHIALLRSLGVTHASLANNHGRDYGRDGLMNAYNALADEQIIAFGDPVLVATSSLVIIPGEIDTVGVIGIHTLFGMPDVETLGTLMTALIASSTYQVAYIHWGNEYELVHSGAQSAFARRLIGLGVDAIIAHHPHVVQDIQLIDGVPVFYSLGNFIFDQYFSDDVREGMNLTLTLATTTAAFTIIPHAHCALAVPCPRDATSTTRFLTALADRSEPTFREQIMAQTITISR